jgi:hypothetical protein
VVVDDEILLHEMYEPFHILDGTVQEQAIPAHTLLYDGLSVHRQKYVPREFIEHSIERKLRAKGHKWQFDGIAVLNAGTIRNLIVERERAFVITDTASEDNISHASILAAPHANRGPSRARKLRFMLLPFLQVREPLAALRFGS